MHIYIYTHTQYIYIYLFICIYIWLHIFRIYFIIFFASFVPCQNISPRPRGFRSCGSPTSCSKEPWKRCDKRGRRGGGKHWRPQSAIVSWCCQHKPKFGWNDPYDNCENSKFLPFWYSIRIYSHVIKAIWSLYDVVCAKCYSQVRRWTLGAGKNGSFRKKTPQNPLIVSKGF